MSNKEQGKIAPRYARALFELLPQDQLEAVEVLLIDLVKVWKESLELRNALVNPAVRLDQRIEVVRDLVRDSSQADIVGNFLALVLENGRIDALPAIQKEFSKELSALKSILALQITSAFPVDNDERNNIQEVLKKECSSLVSVEWKEDKNLIGGLLIQSGDKVLDNTVKGSLDRIRQSLTV